MPSRRPLLMLCAGVALTIGLGACSSTSTGSGPSAAPATTAPPSYATVADLATGLEAKGIMCKLEYEGLREDDKTLSICVVNGEQATLTIWDKPEVLIKFLASPDSGTGVTAVGANWTIDVDTAANADKVIAALGGRVKGPSGPPGSSSGTTR